MSDAVQISIVTSVASTLAALIGLVAIYIGMLNGRKADKAELDIAHNTALTVETSKKADAVAEKAAEKADEITQKASVILEKSAEIHSATNGTLHVLNTKFDVAQEEIRGLNRMVSELMKARDAAAVIAATAAEVPPHVLQINGKS